MSSGPGSIRVAGLVALALIGCAPEPGGPGDAASSSVGATAAPAPDAPPPLSATDLCWLAKTPEACAAVELPGGLVCIWGEVVTVAVEAGECVLGEPRRLCAPATSADEACVDFGPVACLEAELLLQHYQESDGVGYLWRQLPTGCAAPAAVDGSGPWTKCPYEEFSAVPPACWCRCGGPPPGETSAEP
ncbi:hypothetical protein SAMN02745121_01636 [Nannocystis exedens]|uniref:Uncharacterized protein n=1 Tax=Nannocystis exedens TaxID=54 RepID=A0A1I1V937_9BACT|nr:hypothetical protein [Nannocystis exedens]PCC72459.1 hypothetical protein NAEX_05539 [Nannocystis exedens]SFD79532.1 hypothetical protein SAMN02745121_01636 [Nannocystis exedens]